jgi:16S rRNA (adenine1518-N6/adenine1519-N6)-dimethyltransferase
MTRQRLGQHFLADPGWRHKIGQTLPLTLNETWIEIGAGHGEMTRMLSGEGRLVIAVETDRALSKRLGERIGTNPDDWPGVEVVSADVLSLDVGSLADGPFRVYGNLPYYITSPILGHLFEWASRIRSIHVVVQFEVAVRIAARPGRREYGYLSALCQFYTKPEIVLRIPPGAFRPPPRVTSALLRMALPGERASLNVADEKGFLAFVQACFAQKRKTLRNNLRAVVRGDTPGSEDRIRDALSATRLPPDARAEQLSLSQFAALFDTLQPHRK